MELSRETTELSWEEMKLPQHLTHLSRKVRKYGVANTTTSAFKARVAQSPEHVARHPATSAITNKCAPQCSAHVARHPVTSHQLTHVPSNVRHMSWDILSRQLLLTHVPCNVRNLSPQILPRQYISQQTPKKPRQNPNLSRQTAKMSGEILSKLQKGSCKLKKTARIHKNPSQAQIQQGSKPGKRSIRKFQGP